MFENVRWVRPEEIEKRSMEIIEGELTKRYCRGKGEPAEDRPRLGEWSPAELAVVKRCIHTSADFDYAENLYFSPGAAEQALKVLKQGATVVTDTNMAAAGISQKALHRLGGHLRCFMAEEEVAAEAKSRGITRAAVCMEHGARLEGPVVFAVGNAPTALIRLYEMICAGEARPAFIIGVPVGFVNVEEAKELICRTDIPCIVARGRKGGSNIAAAICNALLYQLI